jgi:hypothetical protein
LPKAQFFQRTFYAVIIKGLLGYKEQSFRKIKKTKFFFSSQSGLSTGV